MPDTEGREVSSGTVQEHTRAGSQPAGQHHDLTQEVTSTTLTSAGNTSATAFERLSSSLNQSPATERSPAGKTKARKPYTITKQREKWTDEEHGLFLEALEHHGRAWRRIEEHIGTKTAVQIRSHAQKFFSKLEKEQSGTIKTEGSCKSGAIDIPPPRPKRKPSHPYPRKPDQGSPDSDTPTAWQVSPSRNAHLPRSFSRESLGTSAGCQPLHPAKSPFAQVQHEPTSMHGWKQQPQSQLPSRCSRDSKSPSNMQPHQGYTAPAPPSHEAVSAVAAAASAAAAAAAAAVIAAAGHDIQQQLQASSPTGFPFFGIPPTAFSQPDWQPDVRSQPQAPQLNAPVAGRGRSRSSDASEAWEGTATSDCTHTQQHQGLLKAHTEPPMTEHGLDSVVSHQPAGPQWRAPLAPLTTTGGPGFSSQSIQPCWTPFSGHPCPLPQDPVHTPAGALPSCIPPPPAAPPLPGVNMSNPQSVYDFMSALQWWQAMGGSLPPAPQGLARPIPSRFPCAHASKRPCADAPDAQEHAQAELGGSDGSDADNMRGNKGDQFGDNLLFRHMQHQRAENQDVGESTGTQTRPQGAQPEGGDSNPGSEGNGSGSDGTGNCQGSGKDSGHSSRVGKWHVSAQGNAQQTPAFHHREPATMQSDRGPSHPTMRHPASAFSPPQPSWHHAPAFGSGFPMGMTSSFQPATIHHGHPHLGQKQMEHMHASAFHAAAAAAAMAALARTGPAHGQALPIDPLQRASSLLEQQMASGQRLPDPMACTKDAAPSWDSSATLWHPTAHGPVVSSGPAAPHGPGSARPTEAARGDTCAAMPASTPLRAQSTPVLAPDRNLGSGTKAAAPMGHPWRSSGTSSGFRPYRPSSAAAYAAAGASDSKVGTAAGFPMKRKSSAHLAGSAPPKKRHLIQQEA